MAAELTITLANVVELRPVTAKAEMVTALTGVGEQVLLAWAKAGHIRSFKLGPEKQCTRVYHLQDVLDFLAVHQVSGPQAGEVKP